jgi:hypothetical protein
MKKLSLNENFISRIWENSSYYTNLSTTTNLPVEVLYYGEKNFDSGPDYKNAKLKIDGITYTGDIEIHRDFKGWKEHNHTKDAKYNRVILQVVMWENENTTIPVMRKSRSIPTVVLSKFLSRPLTGIWREIIDTPSEKFKLPCFEKLNIVSGASKKACVEDLAVKRLRHKAFRIRNRLLQVNENYKRKSAWEQVLFEFISEALGYSKNKEQFLKLSSGISIQSLKRLNLSQTELDALMYGSAGFLHDLRFRDNYILKLKDDWNRLKIKFGREPMHKSEWHFFRLRPSNFPTVRIAAASALCYEILNNELLKRIITVFEASESPVKDITAVFSAVDVSGYWKTHYNFGKEKKAEQSLLGAERITDIITNVIFPVVYLYAKEFGKEELESKVLNAFSNTRKAGSNEVTRVMQSQLGYKVKNLSEEQGLIHLHNFYCIKGKCRECKIGMEAFGSDMVMEPLRIILY